MHKFMNILNDRHKGLMNRVFGILGIAQDPVRNMIHEVPIPLINALELVPVIL